MPITPATWNACWRTSRDGWKATTFHTNCDNKGSTLTIIKVIKDGKSYIFGVYTGLSCAIQGIIMETCIVLFFPVRTFPFENLDQFRTSHIVRGVTCVYTLGASVAQSSEQASFTSAIVRSIFTSDQRPLCEKTELINQRPSEHRGFLWVPLFPPPGNVDRMG